MPKLESLSLKVVSYCEIPEEIADNHSYLQESTCDCYVKHKVTEIEERPNYSDDWDLDDWLLDTYRDEIHPGDEILIHIDY